MNTAALLKRYTELTREEMLECFDISKDILFKFVSEITEEEKLYGNIYDYIAMYAKQAYTYYCLLNDLPIQGKKFIKK